MSTALIFLCAAIVSFANAKEMLGFSKLPLGWSQSDQTLLPSKEIRFSLALSSKGKEMMEKTLIEIASPSSKTFRKYLNQQQIADIVGLPDSDVDRVKSWLFANGAKTAVLNPHRDWLTVSATVEVIEKLFSCKLGVFVNKVAAVSRIKAAGSYIIPDTVADVVELVSGMTSFSPVRWQAIRGNSDSLAASAPVTPSTIYTNYHVPNVGTHGNKLGSQAVVEFGSLANFNTDDLQTFFSKYQPDLAGETVGVVAGSNNGAIRASVEANLDVQYIMAAGVYINTTDYKITSSDAGSSNIEDEFLYYTQLANSQISPPLVHSISYGEYGGSYDNATDQRFSYELQKLGAVGVSVLLASGDNGVGCDSTGSSQEFDYPSSPYITMVGATYIDSSSNLEVGATLSSGGFSKDFWQASWQASAVADYFASGVALPSEYYFAQGRAYPDIAAYGQNVLVVAAGASEAVSGTSCSAPIFAGIIAQINHELLSLGKAPLGFLNPWLYSNPSAFTDITSGSNPYQKCAGFQATTGWDPVTGLGTPIYDKLLQAALL